MSEQKSRIVEVDINRTVTFSRRITAIVPAHWTDDEVETRIAEEVAMNSDAYIDANNCDFDDWQDAELDSGFDVVSDNPTDEDEEFTDMDLRGDA
jgi:hypothetical protein